jgi:Spy/CpxP family protein refolding chaperone
MQGIPEEAKVESEDEYQQRRQELIEDAKEERRELEDKQTEALAEIAKGEEIESYQTVSLGELELEVKGWSPGDTTETVEQAMRMAESEDPEDMKQSMETMLSALVDMTVSDTYDMTFWRAYYEKYGPQGMQPAVETILGPAISELEEMQQREVSEDKREAVNGFRTDDAGDIVRSGNGNDGNNPK